MKVSELLSHDCVLVDQVARDKDHLLETLASSAAGRQMLDSRTVRDALLARERLGSTGLGCGIAIPHARINGVTRPIAIAVRLKRPIAFDAVDEKPVDFVVLLLMPASTNAANLDALACVTRRLRDKDLMAQVRKASNASTVFQLLASDASD
ncbi:MAG: IIA-like nitrogen-regulatory protein PtsN [Hyphomicrobiales bacterium]|nr:IIA-like nitrogen-regulatory protein PtsN [Hyphomicrobiales bacterium]